MCDMHIEMVDLSAIDALAAECMKDVDDGDDDDGIDDADLLVHYDKC